MPHHYNVNAISGQSQITAYTLSAAKATATPVQVIGKCIFQFDGQIQIMLEKNSPANEEFTLICAAGVTPPIEMDFGTFGRTIYIYTGAPSILTMWTNTNGIN